MKLIGIAGLTMLAASSALAGGTPPTDVQRLAKAQANKADTARYALAKERIDMSGNGTVSACRPAARKVSAGRRKRKDR